MIRGFVLALPLLIAFALPAQASFFGRVFGSPPAIIEEVDGDPSLSGRKIVFPNDSLTDQGGGVVLVSVASVADVAAVSASTVANKALIDLNTEQLVTVALDTTTIAGDVAANIARADQAAISTTTLQAEIDLNGVRLAEVAIDTAAHAAATTAHGATSANIANRIVLRDGAGDFSAQDITASNFLGNATTASALLADGANCSAGTFPAGTDAAGAVQNCQVNLSGTADFANDFATTPSICSSGQAPRGIATDGDALNCTDYETPAEVAASFAAFNTAPGSFTILGAGGLLVVGQIRIAPFTPNTSTIASDGTSQWAGTMTINADLEVTNKLGVGADSPAFRAQISSDVIYAANLGDGNGQFAITGKTTPNKRMIIGYDVTGNGGNGFGYIKTGNFGTLNTPLYLNPDPAGGSAVYIGGNAESTVGSGRFQVRNGTSFIAFTVSSGAPRVSIGDTFEGAGQPAGTLDLSSVLVNKRALVIFQDVNNGWDNQVAVSLGGAPGIYAVEMLNGPTLGFLWARKTFADRNSAATPTTGIMRLTSGGDLNIAPFSLTTSTIGANGNADFAGTLSSVGQLRVAPFTANTTTITTGGAVDAGTSISIAGGTSIIGHLSATASLDFGATSANTCDDLTMTVTDAADGDTCALGVPNALASGANTSLTCFVSAADTVTVRRCNSATGAAADPASATVRATVWQH